MTTRYLCQLDTAAAAIVTDHAFVPRGEWWTVCGKLVCKWTSTDGLRSNFLPCGLAEAAHASTTLSHEPKEAKDA
jgi:hypothetical protein